MPEPDLIELFAQPLGKVGIRYLISGSVAAMLYGEPRVTHDIDFVVLLRAEDVELMQTIFPSPDFYLPPAEVIREEMARAHHGHFNVIHSDSGLKADFYGAADALHAWAFRNARQYTIRGNNITIAPPEYVTLRKLQYYREGGSEKHLRDIRAMLAVSGDQFDTGALNDWVVRLNLEGEWRAVSG